MDKQSMKFSGEKVIIKEKKLGDTITFVKLPSFLSKNKRQKDIKVSVTKVKKTTEKLLSMSTKDFDMGKSLGVKLKELLKYDRFFGEGHFFFEENGLKKHNKAVILQELDKKLEKTMNT